MDLTVFNGMMDNVTDFVSESFTWVGQFISMITGSPLLMIFVVAIPICGLGIGLLRRLIG